MQGSQVRGLLAMGADESATTLAGGETWTPPPPTPVVNLNDHLSNEVTETMQLLDDASNKLEERESGATRGEVPQN